MDSIETHGPMTAGGNDRDDWRCECGFATDDEDEMGQHLSEVLDRNGWPKQGVR